MESGNHNLQKHSVHHVLAHSYLVYLVLLLVAIFLDYIFDYEFFNNAILVPIGFVVLFLATVLIFWAQKTGRDFSNIKETKTTEHFCHGPYCYTRVPTQWGLVFLVLGLGLVTNSFFIVVFTVVSFLISRFLFMGKYDKLLTEKYGDAYVAYKKLVKF